MPWLYQWSPSSQFIFLCVFFVGVFFWRSRLMDMNKHIYFRSWIYLLLENGWDVLRILGILWVNCSHFSWFLGVWDDLVRPWSSIWLMVLLRNIVHFKFRGYAYSFVRVRLRLAKNNYYPWCRALTQRKINSKPFFEYSIYRNRTLSL